MTPNLPLLALFSLLACAGCDSSPKSGDHDGDDAPAPAGTSSSMTSASVKKESEADKAVAALEQMPKKHHVALAGMALSDFAADRLPDELTKGLKMLGQVDDKMGRTFAASTLTDPAVLMLADRACGKSVAGVMSSVMRSSREDGAKLLWSSCELDKVGLVDRATAERADPIMIMLAHATYVGLGGNQADPAERTVVRALIGAGPATKRSPVKSLPERRRRF